MILKWVRCVQFFTDLKLNLSPQRINTGKIVKGLRLNKRFKPTALVAFAAEPISNGFKELAKVQFISYNIIYFKRYNPYFIVKGVCRKSIGISPKKFYA